MDPISGSIGVDRLISDVSQVHSGTVNNVVYFHDFKNDHLAESDEVEALRVQVSDEKQDLEVYMCILKEVQSVFDVSSTGFPPSVAAALRSCTAREKKLEQLLTDAENSSESRNPTVQQYKDQLKAFDAFHKSVLLFRDLVAGYVIKLQLIEDRVRLMA
jgi:hypothetical protein